MAVLTDTLCGGNLDYDEVKFIRRLTCPYCGAELRQARSGTRKDSIDPNFVPRQYRFTCVSCGANFYSLERRPVGEAPCCVKSLRETRVRQHSRLWFSVGDGVLCRELAHTCPTCGRAYTWHEQLILRGG